jgi:hypothetical protein
MQPLDDSRNRRPTTIPRLTAFGLLRTVVRWRLGEYSDTHVR